MDLAVLKKRISSFRTDGGYVKNVSDEVLGEILCAWESWTGPTSGFSSSIGVSHKGISCLIGKAKKLRREGAFPESEFKEIKIVDNVVGFPSAPCTGIELAWENGKLIRFTEVSQLVDFLKKIA